MEITLKLKLESTHRPTIEEIVKDLYESEYAIGRHYDYTIKTIKVKPDKDNIETPVKTELG